MKKLKVVMIGMASFENTLNTMKVAEVILAQSLLREGL